MSNRFDLLHAYHFGRELPHHNIPGIISNSSDFVMQWMVNKGNWCPASALLLVALQKCTQKCAIRHPTNEEAWAALAKARENQLTPNRIYCTVHALHSTENIFANRVTCVATSHRHHAVWSGDVNKFAVWLWRPDIPLSLNDSWRRTRMLY